MARTNTLFAGQIRNITEFDKPLERDGQRIGGPNVSFLVQVYGEYDKDDPTMLHEYENAVLCTFSVGIDHPLADRLTQDARVALPAAGIIEEPAREITDRRRGGKTGIHRFKGLVRKNITILNDVDVMDLKVKKTQKARVMERAANKGLAEVLRNAARNLFRAAVGAR